MNNQIARSKYTNMLVAQKSNAKVSRKILKVVSNFYSTLCLSIYCSFKLTLLPFVNYNSINKPESI